MRTAIKRLTILGIGLIFLMLLGWGLWRIWPAETLETPQTAYLDMHVHVAGIGAGGSGCYVNDEMLNNVRFPFFLWAMDTSLEELQAQGDAVVAEKLSRKLAASNRVGRAVILAMDGVVDDQGELDRNATMVYVPNDFVADQADRFDNLLFGASVNPLRHDAIDRLRSAHARGAVLIKWIPAMMHVDPSDPAIQPFYREMMALGLPLLSHAGQERSFPGALDQYSDPRKLSLPLSMGLTVIAAHIGTTGSYEGESSYERLLPMFAEYPNLYSEISSLTQINKIGYLGDAMTRSEILERLMYGSDWPLQFYPLVHPLYQFPGIGFGRARAITNLSNPWDRDVAIKEARGVPRHVFERSARLLLNEAP